jgi:hypothetical protein
VGLDSEIARSVNVDINNDVTINSLSFKQCRSEAMDGSGQNLERRYRLEVWRETDGWMESRCSDLVELDRERDAASIYLEFRLKGIA